MKRAEFKEGDKGVIKAVLIIIGKNDCVIQVRLLSYYRELIIRHVCRYVFNWQVVWLLTQRE